jgi:hypothetical protein
MENVDLARMEFTDSSKDKLVSLAKWGCTLSGIAVLISSGVLALMLTSHTGQQASPQIDQTLSGRVDDFRVAMEKRLTNLERGTAAWQSAMQSAAERPGAAYRLQKDTHGELKLVAADRPPTPPAEPAAVVPVAVKTVDVSHPATPVQHAAAPAKSAMGTKPAVPPPIKPMAQPVPVRPPAPDPVQVRP